MRFVFQNKDDVCGNIVGRFISLLGEGDFRPFLPTLLDVDGEDGVFLPHRLSVGIQALMAYLHLLGAAAENLFQGNLQFVSDRRILFLGRRPGPLEAGHATHTGHTGHAGHAKPAEGAQRILVDLHFIVAIPLTKEDVEGVPPTKELSENSMGVSVEGVLEVGAIGTTTTTTAL